jgi:hypothetical protein
MRELSRRWSLRLAVLGAAAGMVLAASQPARAGGGEPDGRKPFAFTVTSPGTGYQLVAGSTVVVTWTSTSPAGNVNLSLVDVLNWVVVATHNNTPDDGSEPFTIPANLPAGRYLIYIENVGVTEWAYGAEFDVLACGSQRVRQQAPPRERPDTSRPMDRTRPAPRN